MNCSQFPSVPKSSLTSVVCATLAAVAALSFATGLRAETLERELLKQAPNIIERLQQKGVKNVGVLKFRIKKGNEPLSDSVGTLNMFLARRLEVALALANDNDARKQLGIIQSASATAAKIPGADHTNPIGRQKLFEGSYRLAWGDQQVAADAFVTGVVLVAEDLKNAQVGILIFDKATNRLEKIVPPFTAQLDGQSLNELGESFVLRGLFDQGKVQVTAENLELAQSKVVETAAKVKTGVEKHPLEDPNAPVQLDILYNNNVVPIQFAEGQALIQEPQQGQNVSFTVGRKNPADKARYAVVLKVNGENSLFRQRSRDLDCNKWVLEPDTGSIVIRGFQKSEKDAEAFRVLAQEESKQRALDYGEDVGLISLTVFAEQDEGELPPGEDLSSPSTALAKAEEAEDLAAMLRGLPSKRPKNLDALKQQLRGLGETRGVIAEGETTEQPTSKVDFNPVPLPIMSASIRYYKP